MATLHGKTFDNVWNYELIIQPVSPGLEAPHDLYNVQLFENGKQLVDIQDSVTDEGLDHKHFFDIARAFRYADRLIDLRVGFSLSRFAPIDNPTTGKQAIARILVGPSWFEILMWGITRHRGTDRWVIICAYFRERTESEEGPVETFRRVCFACTPEEAKRFGIELEAEWLAAEQRRSELGLEEDDDENETR